MYVNVPELEHMPEDERARETVRALKEIIYKINRELEELRALVKGQDKKNGNQEV